MDAVSRAAKSWEFRCESRTKGAEWRWRCRATDGAVIAESRKVFSSLAAALEDAQAHGFRYSGRPEQ